jgi:hypothetical protein
VQEAPQERPDFRRWLGGAAGRLGLALAAVLATLLVLELILAAFFEPVHRLWQVEELFQLDDELIYSLRPSQQRRYETDDFVEHASTNRDGLRDDEIVPRESVEKRIIVLGDSMIFGHGVDDDETFPNQLEAIFRAEGRRIDVINAGVKGYGTDSAFKFFTVRLEPLGLKPDLVIFSVYNNDLYDNVGQPLYTIDNNALVPLDPKRNWIYLLGRIEQKTPRLIRDRMLYWLVLSRFVGRDVYSVLPDLDPAELGIWAARKALLEIRDLSRRGRSEGFEVLVLCVPYRDGPPGFYEWLSGGRKRAARVLDTSGEAVWGEAKEHLFFSGDSHMTSAGNRLLAQQVHADLVGRGF